MLVITVANWPPGCRGGGGGGEGGGEGGGGKGGGGEGGGGKGGGGEGGGAGGGGGMHDGESGGRAGFMDNLMISPLYALFVYHLVPVVKYWPSLLMDMLCPYPGSVIRYSQRYL